MSPWPLGIVASSAAAPAGAYELISTQVLSSSASSVTFSSIPQNYKHLQVRFSARSNATTTAHDIFLRFNSITTNSYAQHWLYGDGSGLSSFGNTTSLPTIGVGCHGANEAANAFGAGIVDIIDYASTSKNTTGKSLVGTTGGSHRIYLASQLLNNTAAITSVQFISQYLTFVPGSRFSLYGIQG
jgi:hypothetical protein